LSPLEFDAKVSPKVVVAACGSGNDFEMKAKLNYFPPSMQ